MIFATITPNQYAMPFEAVKCWLSLRPEQFLTYSGSTLHNNRNMIFEEAKKRDDDLFFIDSDIVFTQLDIDRIVRHIEDGKDIVTGVYSLFDTTYFPNILKRVDGGYQPMQPEIGLKQIGSCGMGFCAISKRVIQALDKEPFNPFQEGLEQHGEDVSFCHRARLKGFQVWCDSLVNVGQVRNHVSYYKNN